jgi:hypothetical protein
VQEIGQKIMLFSMILTVRNTSATPRDLGKFGYRFWYQPFSKKSASRALFVAILLGHPTLLH